MTRPENNSPRGWNWHARRLFGPDVTYDDLPPDQKEQVDAARSAWMTELGLKGNKSRRLSAARRLRERADAIEADVLRGESA